MRYNDAVQMLLTARSEGAGKPIGNNTRLVRIDANTVAVRLHGTNVVMIHNDGTYTLQAGGWRTVTTKQRINKYSPARVSQKNWAWNVGGFQFFDGIRVDGAGRVLNADPALAVR